MQSHLPEKAASTVAEDTTMPIPVQLPSFSHTPPDTVRGRDRWPTSLEYQMIPSDKEQPELLDILVWITQYLEPVDIRATRCIASQYQLGAEFGPLSFTRP
jgi:hypothetical protein